MAEPSNFVMNSDDSRDEEGGHLDATAVAAYLDRTAGAGQRARIEAHLAQCGDCRTEVVEVSRLARRVQPRRFGGRQLGLAAAAAAAVLIVAVWPQRVTEPEVHREAAVTTTVAPMTAAPVGDVDSVPAFVWTSVPRTDGYWVRVYDRDGTVRWEGQTADTIVAAPPAARLQRGQTYYWRVEARTGFDRVAASDLTEFTIRPR